MTAIAERIMGRRKAPQADPREVLDPERLNPPLAEARVLARQLVERGQGFLAARGRVEADLAAKREAFGARALAAELAGAPLTDADHEAHEREIAPMVRESARLAGQLQAVAEAMPRQDKVIAAEEKEAARLIREQFPELVAPLAAKMWAAVQSLRDVAREDSALRDAATAALAAVHGGAPSDSNLPWIQPPRFHLVLNDEAIRSWLRELRSRGIPLEEDTAAGRWERVNGGRPQWIANAKGGE